MLIAQSLVALLGLLTSAGLAVAATVTSEFTRTDSSVLGADVVLERLGDLDQRIRVDFATPTQLEDVLRSLERAAGIKIWWGDIPPQVILPVAWTGDMTVKEALLHLADEFDLIYKVRQPRELMVCPGAPSSCWVTTPVAAAEFPPRLPILLHSVNQPIELQRARNAHNQRSLAFYFDEAYKRYLVELDLRINQLSPRAEPPFRIFLDMPQARSWANLPGFTRALPGSDRKKRSKRWLQTGETWAWPRRRL